MAKLKFKADEVKRLVAHSKGRKHPAETYGQPNPAEFLYLVHDDGVYLMSGAVENLREDGVVAPVNPSGPGCRSFVSYAKGCNPKTDEGCHEESRYLVGGDDFGEPIGLDAFYRLLDGAPSAPKYKNVEITLTKTSMKIVLC